MYFVVSLKPYYFVNAMLCFLQYLDIKKFEYRILCSELKPPYIMFDKYMCKKLASTAYGNEYLGFCFPKITIYVKNADVEDEIIVSKVFSYAIW